MRQYRLLTRQEILQLQTDGSRATDWSLVEVSEDFAPSQIAQSRIEGRLKLDSKAQLRYSTISNYYIGENAIVDSVTRLECRHASTFGNGVSVATINECGGRSVKIYTSLTAQCAYIMAIYRHRPELILAMENMVDRYSTTLESTMGYVGANSQIINSRTIREVNIGANVIIDGVSKLENATISSNAKVGTDVKGCDFIAAEGAKIDNGAIIERCFVGERAIVSNGFTAADSLIFANSHLENGEAASIFAGPYTVSHHKSSLLIAGIFSFFNAGSGSNQSNHLFKCGAVHQSAHLRGTKFSSGAYIMSPAIEAPFTIVIGHHSAHHDTTQFPYSYLVERDHKSLLIPAANISSYGLVRDIKKWQERDKRTLKRDIINFDEHNPYICGFIISAIEKLKSLCDHNRQSEILHCNGFTITRARAERAIMLYTKALGVSLACMLQGDNCKCSRGEGVWLDLAGQYISKQSVEILLNKIESGEVESLESIDCYLKEFDAAYNSHAYSWAHQTFANALGHIPTKGDIADLIARAKEAKSHLQNLSDIDKDKDCSLAMSVSYGLDSRNEGSDIIDDYNNVRGLSHSSTPRK
ncbi:MAG: DUF4954 family protein [Rikenellaceae bacterium]